MAHTESLRVVSFNVWGVELFGGLINPAQDIEERFSRIPSAVDALKPDVVILEEVWRDGRAKELIQAFAKLGYKYSVRKDGPGFSLLGWSNGLLILSRLPLDPDAKVITFEATTRFSENHLFINKGALKTAVRLQDGSWVDVYATHLGAVTSHTDSFEESHLLAGFQQTQELVKFVKENSPPSRDVIVAGDFNQNPWVLKDGVYQEGENNKCYRFLLDDCGLTDSYKQVNADTRAAFTYDTSKNPYAKNGKFANESPGRLDYIFFRGNRLTVKESSIVLNETAQPLSDHFGVMSVFSVKD